MAAGLGSTVFFLLSNLGVWLGGALYPPTLAGLGWCYFAALLFFAATLAGDLVWSVVLSLVYWFAAMRLELRRYWVSIPTRELAIV